MNRAIIMAGKDGSKSEIYQLLIDKRYVETKYDPSISREIFFDEISDRFAEEMLQGGNLLQLDACNGGLIGQDKKFIKVEQVDWNDIHTLSRVLENKLKSGALVIPAREAN